MHLIKFFERLWQGFSISNVRENENYLVIELSPLSKPSCPICSKKASSAHDTKTRIIREASILGKITHLEIPVRRVKCCGIKTEEISWLSKEARMTLRMQLYTEKLCKILPMSHIAKHLCLHWSTVRKIDKARLSRDVPEPRYSQVTKLVMDEFAIHKGHRYATVIANAETLEVLWVGMGRSRECIRPFFEELGEFCPKIEAVAMDMNTSFDLEVKEQCKNAEVVYDLFHVIAKFGREVIDRVRVDRANELKEDKKARKAVKRGRWLLLKNKTNLNDEQQVKLKDLLEANTPLSTVYLLKEGLKDIWKSHSVWDAYRKWKEWYSQVHEATIPALTQFARKLKPYFRGIISSAKYPLGTNALEGMNNKIKVIKRMAYGYRDTDYFFLKIRDAFPGKT